MSKSTSIPILEIVTLFVVLFACVLVVVPGAEEFTTRMLFDPDRGISNNEEVLKADNMNQNQTGERLADLGPSKIAPTRDEMMSTAVESANPGGVEKLKIDEPAETMPQLLELPRRAEPQILMQDKNPTDALAADMAPVEQSDRLSVQQELKIVANDVDEMDVDQNVFLQNKTGDVEDMEVDEIVVRAELPDSFENSSVRSNDDWKLEIDGPADSNIAGRLNSNPILARTSDANMESQMDAPSRSTETTSAAIINVAGLNGKQSPNDANEELPRIINGAFPRPINDQEYEPETMRNPSSAFEQQERQGLIITNPTLIDSTVDEILSMSNSSAKGQTNRARIVRNTIGFGQDQNVNVAERVDDAKWVFRDLPTANGAPTVFRDLPSIQESRLNNPGRQQNQHGRRVIANPLPERISRQSMSAESMNKNNDFRPVR